MLESFMGEAHNVLFQMKTLELLSDEINKVYRVNLDFVQSISSAFSKTRNITGTLALIKENDYRER